MNDLDPATLEYDDRGLLPVVAQDLDIRIRLAGRCPGFAGRFGDGHEPRAFHATASGHLELAGRRPGMRRRRRQLARVKRRPATHDELTQRFRQNRFCGSPQCLREVASRLGVEW